MALREMDGVGKVYDLAQEIGTTTEALDDSRHLLAAGTGAPIIVGGRRSPVASASSMMRILVGAVDGWNAVFPLPLGFFLSIVFPVVYVEQLRVLLR